MCMADGSRLLYEGNWVKGAREGSGTFYYPSGEVYSGDMLPDTREAMAYGYASSCSLQARIPRKLLNAM